MKADGRRLGPPLITSGPLRNPGGLPSGPASSPEPLYVHEYIRRPRRRVMKVGAHHGRGSGGGCRVTEEAARGAVGGGQSGVLAPRPCPNGEQMRHPGARVVAGSAYHCGGPGECHRVAEEVTPASPLLLNIFLLPARVWVAGTRR